MIAVSDPWATGTGFFVTQGFLGIAVLALVWVIRYRERIYREDIKAKDVLIAQKDAEIHALHEKIAGETVPLLTRVALALERRRS